jgi:hypothetical protein
MNTLHTLNLLRSAWFVGLLSLSFAALVQAQMFQLSTIETGRSPFSPYYASAAVVSGNPAVCYYDSNRGVVFSRNSAADGSGIWTTTVIFAFACSDISLTIVDGRPAVSLARSGQLVFLRSSTMNGSGSWTSTVVESSGLGSDYGTSLAVVNGKPAISYYMSSLGDLKFAINSAVDGTGTWTRTTVDTGNGIDQTVFTGVDSSLRVVDGMPSISYLDDTNDDLKFARNSAVDGSGTWTISTVLATGSVGLETSMAIIDGRPAISFHSNFGSGLSFAINSAADGTGTWTVSTLATTGLSYGYGTSLSILGGNPVIGCYTVIGPRLFRNSAANATGTWTALNPVPGVSSGSIGAYPCVLEVGGLPFMLCADYLTNDVRVMRNTAADGSGTWSSTFVENTGAVGASISCVFVTGNPAVAYYDERTEDLKFARNTAADGSGTWTISTVDSTGAVGQHASLKIVDGRPAISYYDETNLDLKFAINSAADGSGTWTLSTVDATGSRGTHTSLAVVAGKPVIIYIDATNSDLKLASNAAVDGSGAWFIGTVDASVSSTTVSSLAEINGLPAVAYSNNSSSPKYARNSSADGSGTWTVSTLDTAISSGGSGKSLAIVDGKPAIAYFDTNFSDLKFASNSAADGSGVWTPSTVDISGSSSACSLTLVGGKPAIAYSAAGTRYVKNSASDGTGAWAATSDSISSSSYVSLIELPSGQPGFAFLDTSQSSGSARWARLSGTVVPEIEMEQPLGNTLVNGSSISYGSLAIGTSKVLTFLVKNIAPGALTLSTPTLLGIHPGDFSVNAIDVPASLEAAQGALFTVTFTPTASGTRTATLRIINNDSNEGTTNLNLSGTCLTFTLDTDGDGLSDAAEFNLSTLGFNPSINQATTLVSALFDNANSIGLYTPTQVQALHVGTPLIQRHPTTGIFSLTLGLEKSTTLVPTDFAPFPFISPQTTINGAGQVEFQFSVPGNAAFFRIQAD